jgi:hypothetical protein
MTEPPAPAASHWADFGETVRFAAVFLWPGNERAQREAVATWAAAMLGVIDATLRRDVIRAHVDAVLDRIAAAAGVTVAEITAVPRFAALRAKIERGEGIGEARGEAEAELRRAVIDPAGGWMALAVARGLEAINADLRRAFAGPDALAGFALALLACAAEHHAAELPSISANRVLWALEAPGRSMRVLKHAWAKAIAPHLWAALFLEGRGALMLGPSLAEDAVAALFETAAGRERVAGAAAWLADWGQRFVPTGAQRAVLAGRALLPVATAPRRPPLPRLPAEMLARLREYRAPKLLA